MKLWGIIGAMEGEVRLLKESMQNLHISKQAGLEFYEGILEGKKAVVVRSGIGKVNAALCAQIMIDVFQTDFIINIGVAGALSEHLEIGDIVLSKDLVEHDFDVRGFGYPKGTIPQMETSIFTASESLLTLAEISASKLADLRVSRGRIATGDVFVSDRSLRETIMKEFDASCAEMEGAAIAHVCFLNQIPFLVIRSMSDKANGEAMENFNQFEQMAAMNSKKLILEMLRNDMKL